MPGGAGAAQLTERRFCRLALPEPVSPPAAVVPVQEVRFRQQQAQRVLRELLAERLTGVAYDPLRMSTLTKQLAGEWGVLQPASEDRAGAAQRELPDWMACTDTHSHLPLSSDDIRERVKALGLER